MQTPLTTMSHEETMRRNTTFYETAVSAIIRCTDEELVSVIDPRAVSSGVMEFFEVIYRLKPFSFWTTESLEMIRLALDSGNGFREKILGITQRTCMVLGQSFSELSARLIEAEDLGKADIEKAELSLLGADAAKEIYSEKNFLIDVVTANPWLVVLCILRMHFTITETFQVHVMNLPKKA